MTSFARYLLLPLVSTATLGGEPIQAITLDDRLPVQVPVGTGTVTTLSFPGPITAIDGARVSADPKTPEAFQLAHARGSAFLSLRALEPGAAANLNVRFQDRTYVFLLREDREPVLSLNLALKTPASVLPAPRLSTTRLLALLDKARAFPLLKEQHPAAVAGVEFRSFAGQTNAIDYGDFSVRIEEVFRFPEEDSLVFRTVFQNHGTNPLEYDPASLAIRAGDRVYPHSITDALGAVPPKASATVYLAITGSPDGARSDLSIKNTFRVLVSRTSASPQP